MTKPLFDDFADYLDTEPAIEIHEPKPTFYYVDAQVGSGKTHALIRYLESSPYPAAIGTQTNRLSVQIESDMREFGLDAKAIFCERLAETKGYQDDEDPDSDDVVSSSKAYRTACKAGDQNLIVSQDVAGKCKENTQYRDAFIDEFVSVFEMVTFNKLFKSSKSQQYVADYLIAFDDGGSEYVRLRRSKAVINLVNDEYDDQLFRWKTANPAVKKVFGRLADVDFEVWVKRQELKLYKEWGVSEQITFFIIMKPSRYTQYRSCTFMGANYNDSLMRLLWKDKVNFLPHPDIVADYHDIRDKAHLVDLYALTGEMFSTSMLDKLPGKRQSFYSASARAIAAYFPEQKHIYCMNNERAWKGEKEHKWSLENGVRLSPDPKGENGYKDCHMAVHMAALNSHPDTRHFLQKVFSIDAATLARAYTYERVLQFIARISIRDKHSDDRKTIIVPDLHIAAFIQEKLGCAPATLIPLDIEELYEKKQRKTRSDSKNRSDQEKRDIAAANRKRQRAAKKAAIQVNANCSERTTGKQIEPSPIHVTAVLSNLAAEHTGALRPI